MNQNESEKRRAKSVPVLMDEWRTNLNNGASVFVADREQAQLIIAAMSSSQRERDVDYHRGYRNACHNIKLDLMRQETEAQERINDAAIASDRVTSYPCKEPEDANG